jgi:hypothetical protein
MSESKKTKALDASSFTTILRKFNAEKEGYDNSGVFTSGKCWEYRAEKFAHLMTMRIANNLEISSAVREAIKKSYRMSDESKTEGVEVKDPTTNKQMVEFLQNIVDAMVFVPNDAGNNQIHVTGRDLRFIENLFTGKDNKDRLANKVAMGKNVKDYILRVVHALVNGYSYHVTGYKLVDGVEIPAYESFKDPIAVSPLRVKQAKDESAAA